jgi:hypothetical protein
MLVKFQLPTNYSRSFHVCHRIFLEQLKCTYSASKWTPNVIYRVCLFTMHSISRLYSVTVVLIDGFAKT